MKTIIAICSLVLLMGCTTIKPDVTLSDGTKIGGSYSYFLQNKAWDITLPNGAKISFDNNNDAIIKLSETVSTLATKVPVVP